MNTPLFSIITPVFNGARTIGQTIESVLAQTETSWEQIIVNDGSTDRTAEIVRSFEDPRLRYEHQANQGRSVARNRAMSVAEGEFLLFLDADDWLLPDALKHHLTFLRAHPDFGVSVTDGYFCTDSGEKIASAGERRGLIQSGDVLPRIVVESGLVGPSHCAAVRRHIVGTHNIRFDPQANIGEDWHFWIDVARHTQFGFTDSVTCMYRWHPDSTTLRADRDSSLDHLWRGRERVLNSSFFSSLPQSTRWRFLYGVLVYYRAGRPDDQEAVLAHDAFLALPPRLRAQLTRLAASEYILDGRNGPIVRRWLGRAMVTNPLDIKTGMLCLLFILNPELARSALVWHRGRNTSTETDLPVSAGGM